jgi:hypothetical protein
LPRKSTANFELVLMAALEDLEHSKTHVIRGVHAANAWLELVLSVTVENSLAAMRIHNCTANQR